ncbi:MAG: apolipoprotein N-acyltransferase [Chitinophagaceae bacterium]|nr:apolipoprotein N-acyltransferase [Chitinophagaceae bacterium]
MSPLTILIFIAWLPLLWVEDGVRNWKRFLAITYLHMLIWNILVTWWVWNASIPGALGAFFANSLIMCVPWLLFFFTKKQFGRWIGYGSLVIYWISFEYLHHNWELSWPWLTLGNVFALHPEWVQWYEYSGTTGGSLWVLLSNIIAYSLFTSYRNHRRDRKYYITMITWIILLLAPIISSRIIASRERKNVEAALATADKNVIVVQPNVDPYEEKFLAGNITPQIEKLIVLSEGLIDDDTRLVVWPETAIPAQVWEDQIKDNIYYQPIWSFLDRHPQISLLTGIDSYKNYGNDKNTAPASARFEESIGAYYDAFNTAAFIDADTVIQLYHKAKLVPGVETLPSFLGFMGKWFEGFGGISGTLGRDSERKVFSTWDNYYKAAPVICYESIYSEYITDYVRKGANILTILTNDGWWGNTPGYKQHMNYGRLRAIESRNWIARSANTGISCFMDPMGNVYDAQPWNVASAIKRTIPAGQRQTFFVRNGDMLSKAMSIITIFLIVLNLFTWIRKILNSRRVKA